MEHPIVTHLLNRHHGLLSHCCESLTRSFDGYFDGILICLIVGQKCLLPLHLWMGKPLASNDIIVVYLLAIMVLMRWHDIEVNFIGRKARIQRMHMDCLNNRLTTFHLNYSLTDRILSYVQILDTSQGRPTCNIEGDLVGIPAAVRLQKFPAMLVLNALLQYNICGQLMVDGAGLHLALQKVRR